MRVLYTVPPDPASIKRCIIRLIGAGWYNRRPRGRKDSA